MVVRGVFVGAVTSRDLEIDLQPMLVCLSRVVRGSLVRKQLVR
jgi:hypothetical protein